MHVFVDGHKNINDIFNNYVCSASHMHPGLHFQNVQRKLCCMKQFYLPNLQTFASFKTDYINGLVQHCSNSGALAMELLQPCTEPLI